MNILLTNLMLYICTDELPTHHASDGHLRAWQQIDIRRLCRLLVAKQEAADPWAAEFAAVDDLSFGTIPAFHGKPPPQP